MIYIVTVRVKRKGVRGYIHIQGERSYPTVHDAATALTSLIHRHISYGDRFVEGIITPIEEFGRSVDV